MSMKDYNLSQAEAIERATIIASNITYELFLDLQKGTSYSGVIRIVFNGLKAGKTFVEYGGKHITWVNLNGNKTEAKEDGSFDGFADGKIIIDQILEGENVLEISFKNDYYTDGEGIISYTDIDGKQYIYTQSEPHKCNRVHPVFDQPDLKGTFDLCTRQPAEWKLISNENIVGTIPQEDFMAKVPGCEFRRRTVEHINFIGGEGVIRKCSVSKPLPCYLFTVIAGEFEEIKCPEDQYHNGISMSIYARKTLLQYVEKESSVIFEYYKRGIELYEEFFGFAYPFSKCDHIYCPEYSSGAMENPGAITYGEFLIFKDEATPSEITKLGLYILHELAHMWFGDTVTMRWWNGLWLNEAFAEFCSFWCLSEMYGKTSFEIYFGWINAQLDKTFGYKADMAVTTHPIAGVVATVDDAFSNFDGITYTKGASTLQQLYELVGREVFSNALKSYFAKYAWKNTELKDLIDEIQGALHTQDGGAFDLSRFTEDWIETAGLNSMCCHWDHTSVSQESTLVIKQSAYMDVHPKLRFHKIKVGFFDESCNLIEVKDVIVQNQEETTIQYDGSKGIKAIVPNYDDITFTQVSLDQQTAAFVKENISKIDSDLNRALLWRCFYDGVRDGKIIKSQDFISMAIQQIPLEKNAYILEGFTNFLSEILDKYTTEEMYKEWAPKVWAEVAKILETSTDKNIIKQAKILICRFASNEEEIKRLISWTKGELEGFKCSAPNLDQQWRIAYIAQTSTILTSEEKQSIISSIEDPTDGKKEWLARIDGLMASDERRASLYAILTSKDCEYSTTLSAQYALGLNSVYLPYTVRSSYYEQFLLELPQLLSTATNSAGKVYLDYLMPRLQNLEVLAQKLDVICAEVENTYFKQCITKIADDLKRRARAIKFSQSE